MHSEFSYLPKKNIAGVGSIRFQTSTPLLPEGAPDYVSSFLENAAEKYFTIPFYRMTAPEHARSAERSPQEVLLWEWFRETEPQQRETLATLELRWKKRSTEEGFLYSIEFSMKGAGVTDDIRDYFRNQAQQFDDGLIVVISGRKEAAQPSEGAPSTLLSLEDLTEGEASIEVGDGEEES